MAQIDWTRFVLDSRRGAIYLGGVLGGQTRLSGPQHGSITSSATVFPGEIYRAPRS